MKKSFRGILTILFLFASTVQGASYSWVTDGNGNWSESTNWNPAGVPSAAGDAADFSWNLSGNAATVTLDTAAALGGLVIGASGNGDTWTLSDGNTLTFDSGAAGTPAQLVVNSSNTLKLISTMAGGSDIVLSGGGVVRVTGTGSQFTGNWTVGAGTTLATDNYGMAKEAVDDVLGSGTITLAGGTLSVLQSGKSGSGTNWYRRVSNNINITADSVFTSDGSTEMYQFGNLTGSGNLTSRVAWSLYLRGDNSQYTGNVTLTSNWTHAYNSGQVQGTGKLGAGDYTFGSGSVTLNGGGIVNAAGDTLIIQNNLHLVRDNGESFFKGGKEIKLQGSVTGTTNFVMNSTTTGTIYLEGNNSAFDKNWVIDASGGTHTLYSNSTDSRANAADPDKRFGIGTIYLKGGDRSAGRYARIGGTVNGTKIYAPIIVEGDAAIADFNGNQEVHLLGDISGSGSITEQVNWTVYVGGDNSAFTGDWYMTGDYTCITNDGTRTGKVAGVDPVLGAGTTYLTGGGFRTVSAGTTGYLDGNIVIPTGSKGNFRYGPFVLRGTVTVDGTLTSDTGNGDPILTFTSGGVAAGQENGILQGSGNVNARIIVGNGGLVSAGTVGTVGTLTFDRSLELQSGSAIQFDIESPANSDQLIVKGDFTLADDTRFIINMLGAPAPDQKFDLISVAAGVADIDWSKHFDANTLYYFDVMEAGGVVSLSVDANAVPEPGTWCLLLLGACGLILVKKNKVANKK